MRLMWYLLGVLAVLALWVATATANLFAGMAMTPDPNLRWVFGAVSVAADLLKVASLFALMTACANRRWAVAAIGVVVFVLCTTHSLRSSFSFVYDELHSGALTRSAEGLASSSLQAQLKAGTDLMAWATEVKTESKPKKDRLVASATSDFERTTRSIQKIREQVLASRHRSHDDPIATALGLDSKSAALASAVFLTLLLELGSGCGFYMLTRAQKPQPPRVILRSRPVNDDMPEPDLKPIEHAPLTLPLVSQAGNMVSARAIKAAMEARGTVISDRALGLEMGRRGVQKRVTGGLVHYLDVAIAA